MSDIEENNSNLEELPLVKKTKKPRTEKQIQQFKEASEAFTYVFGFCALNMFFGILNIVQLIVIILQDPKSFINLPYSYATLVYLVLIIISYILIISGFFVFLSFSTPLLMRFSLFCYHPLTI